MGLAKGVDRGRHGVRAGRCPRMLAIGPYPHQHGGKALMNSWDRQKRKLRLEVIRTRTLFVSTRRYSVLSDGERPRLKSWV